MNTNLIKKELPKNEEVMQRFQDVTKKISRDKVCMEEIKNRNLLDIIFSNNTRDLARAGIAQNELISELNACIQDVLGLIKNQAFTLGNIQHEIQTITSTHGELFNNIQSKILQLFEKFEHDHKKLEAVERKQGHHEQQIDIGRQITDFCTEANEIAHQKEYPASRKLQKICEAILRYFHDKELSDADIKNITQQLQSLPKISLDDLQGSIPTFQKLFSEHKQVIDTLSQLYETEYDMADICCQILEKMTRGAKERYTLFREELIELLNDFLNKDVDADQDKLKDLKDTSKKLRENQFEIALIGEFQGGKSTTFNTLCGGREISPRCLNGGGIKTSATVITAQHIEGDEEKNGFKEWAELDWLTENEVKKRILEVLKLFDKNNLIPEKLDDATLSSLSLNNFEDLLQTAWKNCGHECDDELDKLKIATIQYKVCVSNGLATLCQQNIVGIDQFQQYVKFPEEWVQKWQAKKQNAEFTLEESAFAFLDHILVRLHSPTLAQLGCRITDCPGLFVSKWDTERACEVMDRANAIWYLLNGEKQIATSDLNALKRIKDLGIEDKCFFSINMKKSFNNTEQIRSTDKSILQEHGFEPKSIYPYNAFFAFRSAQGKCCLEEKLTDRDLDYLAEETKGRSPFAEVKSSFSNKDTVLHAIRKLIINKLHSIDSEFVEKFTENKFDCDAIQLIHKESYIDNISQAIESKIINDKARSILISNGSKKILNVMNAVEAEFKRREANANKNLQEAQKNVQEDKEKLDKFIKTWERNFQFLSKDLIDGAFCDEFFNEHRDDMRKKISSRGKKICIEEWNRPGYWSNDDVNLATETRIGEEFQTLLKTKLNNYARNITKSLKFKEEIYSPMTNCIEEMKQEWKKLKDTSNLFNGINEGIKVPDDFKLDTFNKTLSGKIETPSYTWEAIKDIFTLCGRRLFQTSEDRINDFFDTEKPVEKAFDAFNGNPENREEIIKFLSTIRHQCKTNVSDVFTEMKSELEKNGNASIQRAERSDAERNEIAVNAKRVRETIIEPHMQKIADFEREVERFYCPSK